MIRTTNRLEHLAEFWLSFRWPPAARPRYLILPNATEQARVAAAERPWRTILGVYVQAGHGLAAAHAAGIVHRDFTPDSAWPSHSAVDPG